MVWNVKQSFLLCCFWLLKKLEMQEKGFLKKERKAERDLKWLNQNSFVLNSEFIWLFPEWSTWMELTRLLIGNSGSLSGRKVKGSTQRSWLRVWHSQTEVSDYQQSPCSCFRTFPKLLGSFQIKGQQSLVNSICCLNNWTMKGSLLFF